MRFNFSDLRIRPTRAIQGAQMARPWVFSARNEEGANSSSLRSIVADGSRLSARALDRNGGFVLFYGAMYFVYSPRGVFWICRPTI